MNEHSSRSHMVFRLRLRGVNQSLRQSVAGMLSLVDLAGSERIKRSNTAGDRMAESIAINKSLSALGERPLAVAFSARRVRWCAHCAPQAMCSSRSRRRRSTCRTATRSSHGSCSRVSRRIIANLSSASPDAAETLCTLRFASTAQTVELGKAKRNIQAITSNVGRRGSTAK